MIGNRFNNSKFIFLTFSFEKLLDSAQVLKCSCVKVNSRRDNINTFSKGVPTGNTQTREHLALFYVNIFLIRTTSSPFCK